MDRYGRVSTLEYLDKASKDQTIPVAARARASRAIRKIEAQSKDKKLMNLRAALVSAHRNQDLDAAQAIEVQIRRHENQPPETGV